MFSIMDTLTNFLCHEQIRFSPRGLITSKPNAPKPQTASDSRVELTVELTVATSLACLASICTVRSCSSVRCSARADSKHFTISCCDSTWSTRGARWHFMTHAFTMQIFQLHKLPLSCALTKGSYLCMGNCSQTAAESYSQHPQSVSCSSRLSPRCPDDH